MTLETMRLVLGWCSVINIGLLLWWFLILMLAHDWVYRFHSKWFKLPVESFDAIHYAGIAFFKMAIFVFNVVPYFALGIVGGR
ncbi:DUF6868 family protein [Candidatus Omnitrophota bacterium]